MKKRWMIWLVLLALGMTLLVGCDEPSCSHEWGDWRTKEEASCTQSGVSERVCTLCSASEEKPIEATGHVYDKQSTDAQYLASEATCTAVATYHYSCACGAKGTETFAYGSVLPHVYDEQVANEQYLASEATCTAVATYH